MDTLTIVDDVVQRLRLKLPALQVEYFPEKPEEFRLNHPTGAVLVSYISSKYAAPEDTCAVVQAQTVTLCATVVMRQLNGRGGAVAMLELVRRALGGWRPANGHRPVRLKQDTFIGEVAGLWQYALEFVTDTMFVEDSEADELPLLVSINYEEQE
ncbi:Gp37 family protein [Salmonella enterica]|uniref:Gp37 family protein n=1 Tax=Salmonella enterica TaxID=28901 RepID=UPI0021D4A6CC|nr:Gp37 family protein [Salmonella enterica]MCU7097917.1 Gp37 family protein [Salmonella enterica]MCU7116322.1 Gp37 family protein [Salmonella enterica]MCU7123710.1 Gp37 family protein [Salmonella enterica]